MINKLENFVNKRVLLVDDDQKEWVGIVTSFCGALDNDEDYDGITLRTKQQPNGLVEFLQNEIKSIEVID